MDLDRFAEPLPGEKFFEDVPETSAVEPQGTVCCQVCGWELEEEDKVKSDLYEDEFLCADGDCLERYYRKENGLARRMQDHKILLIG